MEVPLVDLGAGFRPIREELLGELARVLDGMDLYLGANVRAFEREFAAYCGVAHGVAVSSGTDALCAALRACEIGPGCEVIVPALTFFASVEAVIQTGATPVLVDVDAESLTIDPAAVRDAITPDTRALMPVHLYGNPVDMDPILALARQHGLRVIEDAAQAHGASWGGRRCGGLGDVGCFSFYFTKNLGAYGEGGFVATRDEGLAQRVRMLRDHGRAPGEKFEHRLAGYNLRPDELQAAVLRVKLRHLDEGVERRRRIAGRYDELLAGSAVRRVAWRAGATAAPHLYPIRVAERDALRAHLAERGVGTGIHYAIPAHRQPALSAHPHRAAALPVTEAACRELLSLPLYPELSEEQLTHVITEVLGFLEGGTARAQTA